MTLHTPLFRSRKKVRSDRCYACDQAATLICDILEEKDGAPVACGRLCCPRHGCYYTGGKHACKDHANELDCWC